MQRNLLLLYPICAPVGNSISGQSVQQVSQTLALVFNFQKLFQKLDFYFSLTVRSSKLKLLYKSYIP